MKTRGSVLLREWRTKAGKSQFDVAVDLEIKTIQHISDLELGKRGPSLALALRLEDASQGAVPARAWTEAAS